MVRLAPLLTVVLLSANLAQLRADDSEQARLANWHHWRGPSANGTAPKADPPVVWDSQTNIQWKAAIPGRGSATPIVWGDQVFVVTAIKTDRVAAPADLAKVDPALERKTTPPNTYYQFVVLCLDRNTGKTRWQRQAANVFCRCCGRGKEPQTGSTCSAAWSCAPAPDLPLPSPPAPRRDRS